MQVDPSAAAFLAQHALDESGLDAGFARSTRETSRGRKVVL